MKRSFVTPVVTVGERYVLLCAQRDAFDAQSRECISKDRLLTLTAATAVVVFQCITVSTVLIVFVFLLLVVIALTVKIRVVIVVAIVAVFGLAGLLVGQTVLAAERGVVAAGLLRRCPTAAWRAP